MTRRTVECLNTARCKVHRSLSSAREVFVRAVFAADYTDPLVFELSQGAWKWDDDESVSGLDATGTEGT